METAITAERVSWNEEATLALADALPGDSMDEVRSEVERGEAALWKFYDGGAWAVIRIENNAQLVIVAFAGAKYLPTCRHIVDKAFSLNLSVRVHSHSSVMVRKWAQVMRTIEADEYVLTATKVNYGR